eukprot:COSAG01_NODE_46545_length_399_cov_0.860000_1_plen_61_part_10
MLLAVAEACLRMKEVWSAADHAQQALKLDPSHAKSIRRLAAANEGIKQEQQKARRQRRQRR